MNGKKSTFDRQRFFKEKENNCYCINTNKKRAQNRENRIPQEWNVLKMLNPVKPQYEHRNDLIILSVI